MDPKGTKKNNPTNAKECLKSGKNWYKVFKITRTKWSKKKSADQKRPKKFQKELNIPETFRNVPKKCNKKLI